jgi:hypothetical protein
MLQATARNRQSKALAERKRITPLWRTLRVKLDTNFYIEE